MCGAYVTVLSARAPDCRCPLAHAVRRAGCRPGRPGPRVPDHAPSLPPAVRLDRRHLGHQPDRDAGHADRRSAPSIAGHRHAVRQLRPSATTRSRSTALVLFADRGRCCWARSTGCSCARASASTRARPCRTRHMARALGVDTGRVYSLTFGLGRGAGGSHRRALRTDHDRWCRRWAHIHRRILRHRGGRRRGRPARAGAGRCGSGLHPGAADQSWTGS